MHILLMIVRVLLGIPQPKVGRDAALESAIAEAESRSMTFGDASVVERLRVWEVWLDRHSKGSPVIVIDQCDGSTKEVRTLPR